MNQVDSFEFIASTETLRKSLDEKGVPESLMSPLQALLKPIIEMVSRKPISIYLLSADENRDVRNYFAHNLAKALIEQVPSAVLVDCDFLTPGMSGIVPQEDALGFLDFLLYGSSLGVVTQEAPQGVRVIGAGSFPMTKKMPVSGEAFSEAARRLVAQSRLAILCGPAEDEEGNIHPIADTADLPLLVQFSPRFPAGKVGPFEEKLATHLNTRVISVRISSSGVEPKPVGEPVREAPRVGVPWVEEGPSETPDRELVPKAGTEMAEEMPHAEFTGLPFEKKQGSSIIPKVITTVVAVALVGFLFWWLFLTRHIRETGGPVEHAAVDTAAAPEQPSAGPLARIDSARLVAAETTAAAGTDQIAEKPVEKPSEAPAGEEREQIAATEVPPDAGEQVAGEQQPVEKGEAETPPSKKEVRIVQDFTAFGGKYLIHVSSFRDIARAKDDAAYLVGKDFSVIVIPVNLGAKGKWYRVYAGPLDTRQEARELKLKLDELPRVKFTRITKAPGFPRS